MARPCSDVVNVKPGSIHLSHRQDMGFGNIDYMYVVPEASSIWRRVICAENLELWTFTQGCLQKKRDYMSFRVVPFPDSQAPPEALK